MRRIASRNGKAAAALALALVAPLLIGGTGRLTSLDQRLLAAHNRERSAAGVPPLAWDPALAAEAAAWGERLAAAGAFEHDEADAADPQGENLWAGTRGAWSPEEMVGGWIEEKRHFRPGRFPDNSVTGDFADVGHYTQLMWRETDRVGCALAAGTEEEVLVCRYRTAGNVVGEVPF
ncbi:MAG TPA: CAP domain-containing protein [Allosphingosinicella sp.]|nr:CAP domain-containing protein [Allosphingosinicella sp.]